MELQRATKYSQIVQHISDAIAAGELKQNEPVPSIKKIALTFGAAPETAVKAYKILKEKGLIYAVESKGFFVASTNVAIHHRVFVLFDTFSSYKETVYSAMKERFPAGTLFDLYFHHFNVSVFEACVKEAAGRYSAYVIVPFENPDIVPIVELLPEEKVYLIDRFLDGYTRGYAGIYQDFKADVYSCLETAFLNKKKVSCFNLYFRNTVTIPPVSLQKGFERFCRKNNISCRVYKEGDPLAVQKGDAYLVIDDEDLVQIILSVQKQKLKIGKDIGILSYNETSLKQIAAGGVSVISTDFHAIGTGIADMILSGTRSAVRNPCRFIDRGSF